MKVNLVSMDAVIHFVTHCLLCTDHHFYFSNTVRVIFVTRKEVHISSLPNSMVSYDLLKNINFRSWKKKFIGSH